MGGRFVVAVAAVILLVACTRGAPAGEAGDALTPPPSVARTGSAVPTPLRDGEVLERFTANGIEGAQPPPVDDGVLEEAWRWEGLPPVHAAAGIVGAGETALGFERLDLATGEPTWTVLREGEIATYLSGGVTRDLVLTQSFDDNVDTRDGLCGFDASTGESRWCTPETSFAGSDATRPDELLAQRTAEGEEAVAVLDARTGEQRFAVEVADPIAHVTRPSGGRAAVQTIEGDVLVVGLDEGDVAAMITGGIVTTPVAADAAATYDLRLGVLTAYDDSGAEVWAWRSTHGLGAADDLLPLAGGVLLMSQQATGLVVGGELAWSAAGAVYDIARAADRGSVLIAFADGHTALVDAATGAELRRFASDTPGIGEGVIYSIEAGDVAVVDVLTGEERTRLQLPELPGAVRATGFGDGLAVHGAVYDGFTFVRPA